MNQNGETQLDYRATLKQIFIERKKRNPRYSLRSFAAHLGLKPAYLSHVLNGHRGLSEEMAESVLGKLNLTQSESNAFLLKVRYEKVATPTLKKSILESLNQVQPPEYKVRDLAVDQFTAISEWYHCALLVIAEIKNQDWDLKTIARSLGIHVYEVENALKRLVDLELLEYHVDTKTFTRTPEYVRFYSEESQEALKRFHEQMLEKTILAQRSQTPKERYTGTETFLLAPELMPEATAIFQECFRKIKQLSLKQPKNQTVYHLGIHMIQVLNSKETEK